MAQQILRPVLEPAAVKVEEVEDGATNVHKTYADASTYVNARTYADASTYVNAKTYADASTYVNAKTYADASTYVNAKTYADASTYVNFKTYADASTYVNVIYPTSTYGNTSTYVPPSTNAISDAADPRRIKEEEEQVSRQQVVRLPDPRVTQADREYANLCATWIRELKGMDMAQQLIAKRAIDEILFEGQMGSLRKDTVQIKTLRRKCLPYSIIVNHKQGPPSRKGYFSTAPPLPKHIRNSRRFLNTQ